MRTEQGSDETVVGTNAGITFMNGPAISSVYAFQGLVNNHVYTIAQNNSILLAGTLGGVSLLKNNVVQNSFTTANSNLKSKLDHGIYRSGRRCLLRNVWVRRDPYAITSGSGRLSGIQ